MAKNPSVESMIRAWPVPNISGLAEAAIAYLPITIQRNLRSTPTQIGLGALVIIGLLKKASNQLSWYSMNNYTSAGSWNADKELVVVTGGSQGIGGQIMRDLAELQVKVIILDVQPPMGKLPRGVFYYKTDVSSSENIKTIADKIREEHGDPTVLINNAGVGRGGTILEEPEQDIRLTFEVNILAHFWTVKEFLPSMIRNNHGHVITIASMASFAAIGHTVDYACTKAGALAFHEGLTQEIRHCFKAYKVRTSIIHPLWTRTAMTEMLVNAGKEFRQIILESKDISQAVVRQIVTQSSAQVVLPSSHQYVSMLRAFPIWMQEYIRNSSSKDLLRVTELGKARV